MTPELGELIQKIWMHESVQKLFVRRNEFQLNDSAEFYFNEIGRISKPDYLPTQDDVLRSRVRTTGIVQSDFIIKKLNFSMWARVLAFRMQLSFCTRPLLPYPASHCRAAEFCSHGCACPCNAQVRRRWPA